MFERRRLAVKIVRPVNRPGKVSNMNPVTSNLSTNQLFQLSKQVLNNQDTRHVEWLMRAPERNRQDIINFIVKRAGKAPDEIVQGMAIAAAERANPKPAPVANDSLAVRIIDLSAPSAPAQDPRAALFVNCATCDKQIAVPAAQANVPAFCSPKCFGAAKTQAANDEAAMLVFMRQTLQFYPCEVNFREIGDQLERWKKTHITTADILEAYRNLNQQGKLLNCLTDADLRAMSSADVAAREKVDPGFGGLKLVQEGQRHLQGAFQIDQTNESRLRPFAAEGASGRKGWV
jgi:hypothetical protein